MSPPPIEATSLHHVTELAANPPLDPRTRLPPNTPPLVLYIARVPGSRDVFLTQIKPREKVVTAGDVQSSLYYLHINGPEDYQDFDAQAPTSPVANPPTSANTNSANLPPLPQRPAGKKVPPPLPKRREAQHGPKPPYPMNDEMIPSIEERPPSPPQHQYLPSNNDRISRKPVHADGTNNQAPPHRSKNNPPPLPARRALPTPPSEEYDELSNTLHAENVRLLRQASLEETHANPYTRSYASHPETLKQIDLDTRPEAGTLTLIRRDPGSGDQWNVAYILDPAVEEVSSTSLLVPTANRRTKKGGRPLYLDITNAAYTQFNSETIERTESRISTSSSSSPSESDFLPEAGVFRRRLYMPGSKFSEHGYANTHRKHSSLSSASGSSTLDTYSMRSDRHHSVDIASLHPSSPATDRRTKGYTFMSPWNGQCEFTTGTAGRSLKCRHHLPNRVGARAVEVSELRFNLPTKSRPNLLASKSSSALLHRRQDSFVGSDDSPGIVLDENGRISLDLGRERAGGGFGGKQAKLGKLIIWPEGVKMLDLLVAANVGLWWRAWERAGGGG